MSMLLSRFARPVAARFAPAAAQRVSFGARSGARWAAGRRALSDKAGEAAEAAKEAPEEKAEAAEESAAAEEAVAEEPSALEAAEAAAAAAKERDDLKNQLLRAIAEAENTRTIARRDVRNAKDFAAQSFAKSMLDISDSLSYAVAAGGEGDEGGAVTVEKLLEGVELTRTQLTKAFASNGVVEYGEVGDAFDPALHEALFEYPDADKTPGSIGQLVKTGFKLHGRVIRAAQAGLVKKE